MSKKEASAKPIRIDQLLGREGTEWQRKQKIALEARSMGSKLREGKPKSFTPAVGRVRF